MQTYSDRGSFENCEFEKSSDMAMETINVSVIVLNSVYPSEGCSNLKGVKPDGIMIDNIFKKAYRKNSVWMQIMSAMNAEDIKKLLRELMDSPMSKGNSLHACTFITTSVSLRERMWSGQHAVIKLRGDA